MLNLSQDKTKIQVVNDQFSSPTFTIDLCNFIVKLIETELFGIYHCSNSGSCTWYEFAKAIFEICKLDDIRIEPCTIFLFPRPAPRPKFSVLDHMSIRCNGFPEMRHWRFALENFLNTYKLI